MLGLATGYLAVGVCTILLQMLPTSTDFLGYEAFKYTSAMAGDPDRQTTRSARPIVRSG